MRERNIHFFFFINKGGEKKEGFRRVYMTRKKNNIYIREQAEGRNSKLNLLKWELGSAGGR